MGRNDCVTVPLRWEIGAYNRLEIGKTGLALDVVVMKIVFVWETSAHSKHPFQ